MSPRTLDYYAILQVAPDADPEVIDAAYRQLMRKYHPDKAGADTELARELNERAKVINQAYAVLRDHGQRRTYDHMRQRPPVTHGPPPSAPPQPEKWAAAPPPRPTSPPAPPLSAEVQDWRAAHEELFEEPEDTTWSFLSSPLRALSAAYYLLPGRYEWEAPGQRDFIATLLLLPIGVVVWLATTGRLAWLLGQSPYGVFAVWLVAGLFVLVTHWSGIPSVAFACSAALLMLSGWLDAVLTSASAPVWIGWSFLAVLAVLLASRPFIFGVLPTLVVCWLLGRVI